MKELACGCLAGMETWTALPHLQTGVPLVIWYPLSWTGLPGLPEPPHGGA